jgi:NAD(P)H-hydrate epimerase
MGQHPETVQFIRRFVQESKTPMVVDADALNALAGQRSRFEGPRIFTPHPGEMSRLTGKTIAEIQADRIGNARGYATEHGVYLVLKGNRSLIAFPDGPVWINPTGSPSMATGGTGDVLTGMIAGLVAQFPKQLESALLAAVYLHGRAGELGAEVLGEKSFMATDLFEFLPEAMREIADLSH